MYKGFTVKKYLFALLISSFPLLTSSFPLVAEELDENESQNYYSLGVSYLDPFALSSSFATTGGYMLFGHTFDPEMLRTSAFEVAAESKLSFGAKGELHIDDYSSGYVIRDGKLAYALSAALKLSYVLSDEITLSLAGGLDYYAWEYQLIDSNSPLNNMHFSDNDVALAWGVGIDYHLTDVAVTAEVNALGFGLGLRKVF